MSARIQSFAGFIGLAGDGREGKGFSLPGPLPRFNSSLPAGSTVASAIAGAAIPGLGELSIRPDTGLRDAAPEQAIAGARHGRIRIRPDVLALPMQRGTKPSALSIESFRYVAHAAPPGSAPSRTRVACAGEPAAARMARFTATWARWIFCALCPRLLALATAACAACSAVACVIALPCRAWAASGETHGMGATWPITTRALCTVLAFIVSTTAAVAYGQSKASFWRTS